VNANTENTVATDSNPPTWTKARLITVEHRSAATGVPRRSARPSAAGIRPSFPIA
jgi:hypothetical protein